MVSVYSEAGNRAQQVGFLAMARQMLNSLVDEQGRLLPGALGAEHRHESSFACPGILPRALSCSLFIAAMVDQVVRDLEGEPDVASVTAVRGSGIRHQLGHDAYGLHRIFDERPGFQLLQSGDLGQAEVAPRGRKVHHLTTCHSSGARSPSKLEDEVGTHPRIFVSGRVSQDLERQGMEAVSGKNSFRLAECAVHGRLAAAKVVIVHARQVVMNQRVDVNRLDCAPDPQGSLRIDREQPRGRGGKKRAKPFASPDRRVAHRFIEPLTPILGRNEEISKEPVDLRRDVRRLVFKLVTSPVDRLSRHRMA